MERCAMIMAGGAGERFWPLSRRHYPKQLLRIGGDRSMLGQAIERISPLVKPENVFVVTGKALKKAIENDVPELPPENVIAEPEGKNTAACLALASAHAQKQYGDDVVMVVLTADHNIRDVESFREDCRVAIEYVETHDSLVTFGIVPTRPETGYGYIEMGEGATDDGRIHQVESFREKPNAAIAREFQESGRFLWNSGMFVWRNSVLQKAFEQHLPSAFHQIAPMVAALASQEPGAGLAAGFAAMPQTSIDFGILEKADNVVVVRASFDWDDVGTWGSIARLFEPDENGNILFGKCTTVDCEDSILYSVQDKGEKLIVGFGLKDIIVVNTGDAILVLPSDRAQLVKDVVNHLRETGKTEYL